MEEKRLMQFGLFWVPPRNISEQIEELKREMLLADSQTNYALHPVHATVFLCNSAADPDVIIQRMHKTISSLPAFNISFEGWLTFFNDAGTGKHTLTVGINLGRELQALQKKIAEELLDLIAAPIKYQVPWEGSYLDSYNKWGFPFVGTHWRPHLTVGSSASLSLLEQIQKKNSLTSFSSVPFQNVSLFLITGDAHKLLETFYLGNR